jgi:hypothetical protein
MGEEMNGREYLTMEAAQNRIRELEKRVSDLLTNDSQAVDEFNAGYQAFHEGMDLDTAEQLYRHALDESVPSYDEFSTGYAWAKFQKERDEQAAK